MTANKQFEVCQRNMFGVAHFTLPQLAHVGHQVEATKSGRKTLSSARAICVKGSCVLGMWGEVKSRVELSAAVWSIRKAPGLGENGRVDFRSSVLTRVRQPGKHSRPGAGLRRPGRPLGSWVRTLSQRVGAQFIDWPTPNTQSAWTSVP